MNRVRFFVLVVFFCFLFYSSSSFSSDSPFSNHPEGQTSVFVGDGRGFYGLDEDKRHSVVQEREVDPYQSLSTYKEHLKKLLQSGSYFKLALNVSFCAFFVTSLFILPTCLVIYAFMTQPEKLFFDILYEKIESLIDPLKDKDIVVTGSQVGDSLSYFFKNSTNLTSLVFLAAGEVMNHHGYSEEYYRLVSIINERIGSFFKTRRHKGAFNNTGGFLTRFCFDPHDQEYDVETLVSENSISDPLDVVLKKECSDRQVFVTQNIGDFHKWTDRGLFYFSPSFYSLSVHVHDVYRQVFNTQRRLMQIGGETSKEEYLTTVEEDFLKKNDTQSLLTMVVDSLLSHQCPSEGLFDRLSTSVKGLRNPLKYIGDKYLQIKLWYREGGSIRHVVAMSTNNITDRSTNHNETTLCNFASEAHLEGADARLDLDRFRYLRVIAGGRDLSFTLPPTITHALQKTFTDHFSKEHTASKTLTDQKTETHTHTENHTKTISLLNREQYFDLLAKGVWFNESDAYLNSVFQEIGGLYGPDGAACDFCPLYGRDSYFPVIPINKDGTNSTTFGFLYNLPSRFIFQLFGLSYGSNSNTTTRIYLGKYINTTNYFNMYTGNTPISFGNIFHYYNESVVVNNPNNASFLRIMIPNPQRDPNVDPRYFGLAYFRMAIISLPDTPTKTSSKSISLLSREQYFDLLSKGVWFKESDAYLNSIFPEIGGLYGPYGNGATCVLCPSYGRTSYSISGTLPSNKDGSNSTTFGFLYDLPNRFIFQLFGDSYGSNSNTTTKVYLGKEINTSDYFELYTGNTPISPGAPFYYYNESVIASNSNNASFLRIMIPNPQRDPNGDSRYFGLAYFRMAIIPL